MKIVINNTGEGNFDELIEIWETSVRATHDFLGEEDIQTLKPLVRNEYFRAVELFCAQTNDKIVGFIGISSDKIEMLFLRPEARGQGIGRRLVEFAIQKKRVTKVDVNEQNPEAVGFYEHLGFRLIQRNPTDSQGRPFPILEMSRKI